MAVVLWCTVWVIVLRSAARDGGAPATAPGPPPAGTLLSTPRQAPALQLIDDRGRPFSLRRWRGRWVVLAPSLTLCHEECPLTTGALSEVLGGLRRAGLAGRAVVAEVTVDPWRDTPARLRAYRRLAGIDVSLLTGTPAEIRRIWSFFGVYYRRVPEGKPPDVDWLTHAPETFDVRHTDGLFVLDPAGRERLVVDGMADVAGRQLPAGLRTLLSAQGRANLAHPSAPWTPAEVLGDLARLMGPVQASPAPSVVRSPTRVAVAADLAGSPPRLAALHAQAGLLLPGAAGLVASIHALRGYPVVVNAWGSWCLPCRAEFPLLAASAARYGRRVAFLGADVEDDAANARAFLAGNPVSYPSYQTASAGLGVLGPLKGTPTTFFIDRAGRMVYEHAGQYETAGQLDADIELYALGT